MIIDAHIHVGTWDHPDFLGRTSTLEQTLEVLTQSQIAGAVLMPTDQCKNAELLTDIERMRSSFTGPLWGIAWVRPGDDDLQWLEGNHHRLAGLKIHPSLSRIRITDDAFTPYLEFAKTYKLAVIVHCGRWQEIASYRFAMEVAQRYPEVSFSLAHAGGDTPPLATAAADYVYEHGLDNVYFDFSGLREFWVVERNIRKLGASKYLMGSDYSLAHPKMYLGAVAGMSLSEDDRALVLGGNAQRIFGG